MEIQLIISSYLVPFTGLALLIAMILINPLFSKRQTFFLIFAAIINIILISVTAMDYIFAAFGPMWQLRRITTFINFAMSPIIPICLLKIFEENRNRFLVYIPTVMNAVICFISIFYCLVFFITPENTYRRGPLFFFPLVVTIGYIIMLMIKPLYGHNQNRKYTRVFLLVIIFLIISSMFFEIYFGYRFLNYGISALGLMMYYLLINIQGYSIDPLTGVYNRIKYNRFLEGIANSSPCILALADLDNFKQVNDNYGHDAGDEYLIRFATLLYDEMNDIANVYRIGGDEFVLIAVKISKETFEERIEAAKEKILKEGIGFSLGITEYNPKDDIEQACKEADKKMYKNKQRNKG